MDFSIIDKLYDIYLNEDIVYAEQMFSSYFYKYQQNGEKALISTIQDYIKQQSAFVSNYFISDKDEKNEQHNAVRGVVAAFENIVMPVESLIVGFANSGHELDGVLQYESNLRMLKPHDLFNIDKKIIEDAINSDDDTFLDDYNKVKDLIEYVKKNKILSKIYKDNSWHEIDFEELIYSLYDYIKDKNLFNVDLTTVADMEFFLFGKIKENCSNMLTETYDKFRPNLHSNKQIRADFGKLIFCKNLLLFYKTGIMPDNNGFIDFTVEDLEHMDLIDDFKKLYNRKFDEEKFKSRQENFICNPEVYCDNYNLEAKKCLKIDDKLIAGFIVSCSDKDKYVQNDYLIHIQLNDISNSHSKYEMQISIVPHGNLDYRLQLMRLDNWGKEQAHKNVAKKLSTTTHIHLYNEFDILRGKTNGSYDIAYNIEGAGVEFEESLKTFLKILDLDSDISKEIYDEVIESLKAYREIKTGIVV